MKTALIIQARLGSTRLPRKVFLDLHGKPIIQHLIDTCRGIPNTTTIVAVPCLDYVTFQTELLTTRVVHGHEENNLLDRYEKAFTCEFGAFVRLTSDCPVIPRWMIETVVKKLETHDYVSNAVSRTFPDGFDCQGITRRAWEWYKDQVTEEEHLFQNLETKYLNDFIKYGFSINHVISSEKVIINPYHPDNKLSIDTEEDLARVKKYITDLRAKSEQGLGTTKPSDQQ